MIFKQFKSGGGRNFDYLIAGEAEKEIREAVLTDPSPGNGFFKTSKKGNPFRLVNCSKDTWIKTGCIIKRLNDFNQFLLLENNRATYKKEHGIK